jgi:hypothetical protein
MEKKIPNYKDKILAQFEADIALKLIEFAETISNLNSDIFVFMSRKFCCLYELLISIGVPPIQKPIVSDKVLDIETDFFKNKVVTIVDDIIICGTTVWKAKEKLLNSLGAKEVRTAIFCVNEKYWVKELIEPNYKSVVLSEDRSLTFCTSTVSSLSIAPIPYSVEFPLFNQIEIKTKYWHQIISSSDWDVYDITTKLQEDNNVSTFTLFPSVTIWEELNKSFGENIVKLIDITKIRLYAKKIGWGVSLSILPIITFKALSKDSVNKLFNNLLDVLRVNGFENIYINRFKEEFSNATSQLRFIQYTTSLLLFSKFRFSLQRALDKTISFELREWDVELLFGNWNLPSIKALSKIFENKENVTLFNILTIEPAVLDLESTELTSLIEDGNKKVSSELINKDEEFPIDDPRNIFSDFSNIFLSLYFKKEIPSRLVVKDAAPKKEWERIRNIDRLETGITWIGILKYLKKTFKYELTEDVKNVLSLVLDYSIDKGICVPVTRHDTKSDIIFRAFRHGEDVKFAEEETELCGFAIENAQKAMQKGQLPKLFLEKLLVLFIRIGASRNILQVQYGTSGQEGIAKIGFFLQGAVVKLKKRNAYNAESNLWLSKHLLEKEVIKKTDKGMYSFNKHFPAVQISSSSRTESQKFGLILGMLYKGVSSDEKNLRINDDDLIYLSTCFRPRDVAAALLVELDLYIEDLFPIIDEINSSNNKKQLNKSEKYKKILRNRGYFALNSLHKKTIGWSQNGAKNAIEKGIIILDLMKQPIAKYDWEAYWTSLDILKREDEEKIFDNYILQLGQIGHMLLFNINLLEIVLSNNIDKLSYDKNEKLNRSIEKLKSFYIRSNKIDSKLLSDSAHLLMGNLPKLIESEFANFDEQKTLAYINNKFSELNYNFSKIAPLVSSNLEEFEQRGDGTIYYDYVLYYDIVDSTATKRMKSEMEIESYRNAVRRAKYSINNFVNHMQSKTKKEKDEMYCWNGDSTSTNDAKFVFFSSSKVGFSIRRAREFIDRLFSYSTSEISFRVIACPTNAFYSRVFKRFQRTEVEGEQFWEHYSRIHKRFKILEEKYDSKSNLILVIGNESIPVASDKLSLHRKLWEGEIETVIAAGYFKTYGELWTPK